MCKMVPGIVNECDFDMSYLLENVGIHLLKAYS